MTRAIAILLLAAAPVAAQQPMLPFKSAPTVNVKLTCAPRDLKCQQDYHVLPRQQWTQPLRVTHRTADRRFDWLTGASVGMAATDLENSIYALRRPGTYEVNPLYGRHPSRAIYYGVGMPLTGALTYLSWREKREDDALRDAGLPPHKWYARWWLGDVGTIVTHTVGIAVTLAETGR